MNYLYHGGDRMQWHINMPQALTDQLGQVIMLEAESGRARSELLQHWLYMAREHNTRTWFLSCNQEDDGPWAGLKDLFDSLLPQLWEHAPDLVIKHDYELAIILPALRRRLLVRNPTLTEQSSEGERTRNWPADRAYRVVHGLIDLLEEWDRQFPHSGYMIACDYFDRAGSLVRRFFSELMRRCSQRLRLVLLIAVAPGANKAISEQFDARYLLRSMRLDLLPDPVTLIRREEMTKLAQELTQQVGDDAVELEIYLPQLIKFWSLSEQPDRALMYQMEAFSIYNARGFYEDSLIYGEAALEKLVNNDSIEFTKRLRIYIKLYGNYVALKRPFDALRISNLAMSIPDNKKYIAQWCYLIAMLYARFLPERDLEKAEEYLERGLEEIKYSDLAPHTKYFQTAFNRNGLALIRYLQGHSEEAIAICKVCLDQLDEYLAPDVHRLHRSVLLYNIAQVYATTGPYEEAISYFTSAMAMDPNYSEYYNERGNVYLEMGRLNEALSDYLKAIDLSPPYMEVWTNLGRCYLLMGRPSDAIRAYTRALDLEPTHVLPYIGRAEAFEEIGEPELALNDYTAALSIRPDHVRSLANRAILHYQAGRLMESLADLDHAIVLASDIPELYQNRAVALSELRRFNEAASDLQTYLRLCPDVADRSEVEHQLSEFFKEQQIALG
jgi:tetratricopeptide (TPR) repeat protein